MKKITKLWQCVDSPRYRNILKRFEKMSNPFLNLALAILLVQLSKMSKAILYEYLEKLDFYMDVVLANRFLKANPEVVILP